MSRTTIYTCCLAVASTWFAASDVAAQDVLDPEQAKFAPMDDPLFQLAVGPREEWGKGFAALQLEHQRRFRAIFLLPYAKQEAKDENARDRRRAIILLLADYGSTEVVRFLVENIDLRLRAEIFKIQYGHVIEYPCAISLAKIRHNSVPFVLERLQHASPEEVSDKAIELYALVLRGIYSHPEAAGGSEEAIAVVERAKQRAREDRRPNHDRLLEKLREFSKPRK